MLLCADLRMPFSLSLCTTPAYVCCLQSRTPQGRLKVEVLAQEIRRIEEAVAQEIGVALGVTAGFNSQDGD